MKNSTIKKYARNESWIQIEKSVIQTIGELKKYRALCLLHYKGQEKEYYVSAWAENSVIADKKIEKLRIDGAYNILKYDFQV